MAPECIGIYIISEYAEFRPAFNNCLHYSDLSLLLCAPGILLYFQQGYLTIWITSTQH
jgi:hypothetical protein